MISIQTPKTVLQLFISFPLASGLLLFSNGALPFGGTRTTPCPRFSSWKIWSTTWKQHASIFGVQQDFKQVLCCFCWWNSAGITITLQICSASSLHERNILWKRKPQTNKTEKKDQNLHEEERQKVWWFPPDSSLWQRARRTEVKETYVNLRSQVRCACFPLTCAG